jgi:hypothetical protein
MNKPTFMFLECDNNQVIAQVNAIGTDWVIEYFSACGYKHARYYRSTLPARADNGALEVSKFVRQKLDLTGTWEVK